MAIRKSMRGENVDIDLIKMKHQLEQGAKSESAIKRESYVDNRRRRSSSRRVSEMIANEHMVRQKLAEQNAIKSYAELEEKHTIIEQEQVEEQPQEQEISMDNFNVVEHEKPVVETVEKQKPKRIVKKQG